MPPLSVMACLWRDRGCLVGLPLWYIIGLFLLLTNCQVYYWSEYLHRCTDPIWVGVIPVYIHFFGSTRLNLCTCDDKIRRFAINRVICHTCRNISALLSIYNLTHTTNSAITCQNIAQVYLQSVKPEHPDHIVFLPFHRLFSLKVLTFATTFAILKTVKK